MTARMNTPGFTAEWSLYTNSGSYALRASARQHSGARRVTPQRIPVYHCTSYDSNGCRECCDLGGGGCYTQCVGDPRPM
jgi:hypothetical protein